MKSEVRQNKVTANKGWPRLVKRCHYVIHKIITIYDATPDYQEHTASEIPPKSLLDQNTVLATIFWPLNVKIKPIKCLKFDDNICDIFITLSHNRIREYSNQWFPSMHDHKHPYYQNKNPQGLLNPLTQDLYIIDSLVWDAFMFYKSSFSACTFTFTFCWSWLFGISLLMFSPGAIFEMLSQWRDIIRRISPLMFEFGWSYCYDVRKLFFRVA